MATTELRSAGRGDAEPRRRPLGWWLGLGLLLAGLALLGWVGWQFYGTNWVSQRRQAETVEQLQRQWEVGSGTTFEVTSGGTTTTASALIKIPRFGSDYAVPILQGVSDEALSGGYGHFEKSAQAGQRGNFALAAHRITHGEPLRGMPDLQPGDEVLVVTKKWTYTYVLTTGGDDLVVPFTDAWVLDELPTNPDGGVQPAQRPGQRLITLTTCSELFHTDDRMIAFGELATKERS